VLDCLEVDAQPTIVANNIAAKKAMPKNLKVD
jgi:hypothetical protein